MKPEITTTLSQAVANLEKELAYHKEQGVKAHEKFKNFDMDTVSRAVHMMVENHLMSQEPHCFDMKRVYIAAGVDVESKAFHNAVVWITMRWSSRDRQGEEDMLEYFIQEMPRTYLSYLHPQNSLDHATRSHMENELGKDLQVALHMAKH
jgi:hypothetical protein